MQVPVLRASLATVVLFASLGKVQAHDAKVSVIIQDRVEYFAAKATAYGREIGMCLQNPGDEHIRNAKLAYVDLVLVLRTDVADFPNLPFGDTAEDRALKDAYQKLLRQQAEFMSTHLVDVLQIAKDKKLTADERTAKVTKIIEQIEEVENPLVKDLRKAIFRHAGREK
jgi:hypothetical protein